MEKLYERKRFQVLKIHQKITTVCKTYEVQEAPKRNAYFTVSEIAIMTLDCGLSRKSQDSKRGLE